MSETQLVEQARAAIGLICARRRHDDDGYAALLEAFPDGGSIVTSLSFVAEVAVSLLAEATEETFDEVAERLSASLAMLPVEQGSA